MSDFDKYFADRLNEESEFPNQGKNWNAMSKRLDAYAAGNLGGTSYLRFWKLAAASLVAIAAYLVWEIQNTRAENKELRAAIAEWQAEQGPAVPTASLPGLLPAETADAAPDAFPPTALPLPGLPNRHPDLSHTNSIGLQRASIADTQATHTRQAKHIHPAAKIPGNASSQLPSADNNNAYAQTATPPSTAPVTDHTQQPAPAETPTLAKAPPTPPNNNPGDPAAPLVAAAPVVAPPLTPLAALDPAPLSSATQRAMEWPAVPAAALVPPVIKPERQSPARFRAGVQLLAGQLQPKVAGISTLKGAGVALEYRPINQFWLTASADWLSQSVCVDKNLPKDIYPGKPPKPFSPHHELVKIDASPKQQQYSLGLRYVVPLRFFIRPSVRVAHSWVHVAPGIFSFEFEDKDPGPGPGPGHHDPEYYVTRPEARWLSNIWRVGGALEFETSHWVFRLGADYSRNAAASQEAPHAVVAQVSAQYTF
ncbi:MAG: hypothetical protein IT260_15065 [Saprospiraceae bacterium]|nr:hypothetical protein [Saprospiraceae bacterium]